jgi:hypothetical protein
MQDERSFLFLPHEDGQPIWASRRIKLLKNLSKIAIPACLAAMTLSAPAAQLSGDARAAIPHEVQQLVVIDYRAMQNSSTAMELRDRVMPPDLRQFEEAIRKSGLNDNHDVDELAFALFRTGTSADDLETVGIAQGQFDVAGIVANFRKQKVVPKLIRSNKVYPLAHTGMMLCFVDPSTMVFGSQQAIKAALDVRDGSAPGLLTNAPVMEAMQAVDSAPLWSVLDKTGTQVMMKQVLGQAGSVTDYDSVRKRLESSWYGMDFQHGVKFDLTIATGDSFAAATISSLLSAAVIYKKMSGDATEKTALAATDISSNSGQLSIHFATSNSDFDSLLKSSLFQSMVH